MDRISYVEPTIFQYTFVLLYVSNNGRELYLMYCVLMLIYACFYRQGFD